MLTWFWFGIMYCDELWPAPAPAHGRRRLPFSIPITSQSSPWRSHSRSVWEREHQFNRVRFQWNNTMRFESLQLCDLWSNVMFFKSQNDNHLSFRGRSACGGHNSRLFSTFCCESSALSRAHWITLDAKLEQSRRNVQKTQLHRVMLRQKYVFSSRFKSIRKLQISWCCSNVDDISSISAQISIFRFRCHDGKLFLRIIIIIVVVQESSRTSCRSRRRKESKTPNAGLKTRWPADNLSLDVRCCHTSASQKSKSFIKVFQGMLSICCSSFEAFSRAPPLPLLKHVCWFLRTSAALWKPLADSRWKCTRETGASW